MSEPVRRRKLTGLATLCAAASGTEVEMEHLNFCRGMSRQFAAMVEVPGLDAAERARMSHLLDLAAASQKFLLPNGGLLMDDPELRAIDTAMPLRLPHQFLALEFLHAEDERRPDVLTKCIVFVRERNEFVYLSVAVCQPHDAVWRWVPECAVPVHDYVLRDSLTGRAIVRFRPLAPWEAGSDVYGDFLKVFMCFLNALACLNVRVARSEPRKGARKVKAALPFDTYHVLTIDVPGRPGDRSGIGGAHRSPREHLRRGHIRRLVDGRGIWVNATVVAAGRGVGVISKDYALRAAA